MLKTSNTKGNTQTTMKPSNQILIVDDVADNIQIAMSILQEDGYEFSFADNGNKALSILRDESSNFDLILFRYHDAGNGWL